MKKYSLQLRHLKRYWPAGILLIWFGVNIICWLIFPAQRVQLFYIIPLLLYLGFIYFIVTIPYAVILRDDGTMVLRSVLKHTRIPIPGIDHIIRSSPYPRIRAASNRVITIHILFGTKKAYFLMAPDQVDQFVSDICRLNPDIQFHGFETLADLTPTPSLAAIAPSTEIERAFKVNTRPLRVGLIVIGIVSGWLALSGLVMLFTGIGVFVIIIISLFQGDAALDVLLASLAILVSGCALLLWAWLMIRHYLRHPLDIRLQGDTFRIKTRIRTLIIPANDIRSIRVFRKQSDLVADVRYRRKQKTGNLRIQLLLVPEFLDFVAAVRSLNPEVQLDGI